MERLPGVDAGFLYMETPSLHMHTLKIAVLDVSEFAGVYSFDVLKEELGRRLSLLPPFRRRVVSVPLAWHHPVWVEDPEFGLDAHVWRYQLPAPGSWEQVEDAIGVVASTPLDRGRPLWEIAVLEGLADGRVVTVAKIHHTLADGVAAASLLANVMAPVGEDSAAPPDDWRPGRLPGRRELLVAAIRDWARDLLTLPRLLVRTMQRLRPLIEQRRGDDVNPPRPLLDTPRASFNGALTPRRSFATATVSVSDVKRVAKANDVTMNDVVLAMTAGALRSWLDARGEKLTAPLVASVPVATERGTRLQGNRVSSLITSLCTDVDDPVERLRRISATTKGAKGVQQALGEDMLESWVQFTPPGIFSGVMRLYSRWRGADYHRPPINLVVSNVPGPREPLHISGVRLDELFSVGPILEGIGLNVTAWSYLDQLNLAAIACPDLCPDLRAITRGLGPALDELLARLPAAGSTVA